MYYSNDMLFGNIASFYPFAYIAWNKKKLGFHYLIE